MGASRMRMCANARACCMCYSCGHMPAHTRAVSAARASKQVKTHMFTWRGERNTSRKPTTWGCLSLLWFRISDPT